MKYIKTYEYNNQNKPKFKIGDIVYAKNNTIYLTTNKKYTIKKINRNNSKYIFYELEEIEFHSFVEESFISELEYNSKKYNI